MNSSHGTGCTMIMTTSINHRDDDDEDDDSDEEEELTRATFLDNHCGINNEMLSDVDLVNTPNTWLPAYGYQIQQHSFGRPTHEDFQANESTLTQHIDFLETIFEETSEELQSDSDRSDGTTHWLGSDSEAESVIHITSNQTTSGEQLDCSESECHSIVQEKCRCQSNTGDCYCWCKSSSTSILKENRWPNLSRSLSRSSTSSCSSSLIQFENNERACAVVSPSGYSYDSLEYSNCSNSYFDNTSPDSLEDSENEIFSQKKFINNTNTNDKIESFSNIRPYRSFESLETCDNSKYVSLSSFKKCQFKRDVWQETYDHDTYSRGNLDDNDNNYHHRNHPSLDWTSTIDLREIGLESDGREAVLLSLTRSSHIGTTSDSPYAKLNIDYGNNSSSSSTALRIIPTEQRGWSNSKSSDFNFRFTNKSRSVPSLPSDFDGLSSTAVRNLYYNELYDTSSTGDLFSRYSENFTRVNSVPVDINLFGSSSSCTYDNTNDVSTYDSVNSQKYHEMADDTSSAAGQMANYSLHNASGAVAYCNNDDGERNETVVAKRVKAVKEYENQQQNDLEDIQHHQQHKEQDQHHQRQHENQEENEEEEKEEMNDENIVDISSAYNSKINNIGEQENVIKKKTVKIQDRGFDVLTIENNIDAVVDEAIRLQLENQVDEINYSVDNAERVMESIPRISSVKERSRRMKNNASYELAQQWEIDEKTLKFLPTTSPSSSSSSSSSTNNFCNSPATRKRVLNNASYELAQQSDYIKGLQLTSRPFQRMNACDELHETIYNNSCENHPMLDNININNNNNKKHDDYLLNNAESSDKYEQDAGLLNQIKKNSLGFSIYGESLNSSTSVGPILDDEVDYSYLETKVIGDPTYQLQHYDNTYDLERDSAIINDQNMPNERKNNNNSNNNTKNNSTCVNEYNDELMRMTNDENNSTDWSLGDKMALVAEYNQVNGEEEVIVMSSAITQQQYNDNAEKHICAMIKDEVKLPMVFVDESSNKKVGESSQLQQQENHSHLQKQQQEHQHQQQQQQYMQPTVVSGVHATTTLVCNHASTLNTRSGNSIVGCDLAACGTAGGGGGGDEERKKKKEVIYEGGDNQPKSQPTLVMLTKSLENECAMVTVSSNDVSTASTAASPASSVVHTASATSDDEKKKRGLGGFLQRFSKFRFSGRSKSPRLESKRTPSNNNHHHNNHHHHNNISRGGTIDTKTCEIQASSVGKKLEHNYIIIPLHPPDDDDQHHRHHYNPTDDDNDERKRISGDERRRYDALKYSTGVFTTGNTDTDVNASSIGTNGRPSVCTSKPPLPPLQGIRACAPSPRTTSSCTTSTSETSGTRRRAITDLGNPAIIKMAKARAMQQHHHHPYQYHYHHQAANQLKDHPGGLLETDLDADINQDHHLGDDLTVNNSCDGGETSDKKTRSLLNLTHTTRQGRENVLLRVPQSPAGFSRDGNTSDHPDYNIAGEPINQRPHKSMEFLLDKENLHFIKPPENELQKGMAAERVPSEHELRVQRSLQRLNVPDWYKNSPAARDGFRLKRHSDASQHSGWRSLGSKTTSLSSLSSSSNLRQPNRGLLSSPSPQPVFSRWSTSLLNSTGSSPATSTGSSFTYRQPYLGWRSQERLANPRTPAERLAQGILPQLDAKQQQQQRNNQQLDVRNSIKEVTSAIVHYVQSGQEVTVKGSGVDGGGSIGGRISPRLLDDANRSNEEITFTSLRGEGMKLCWMESSFVGSKPADSPETPISLTADKTCSGCNAIGIKSCSCVNSANSGLYLDLVSSDASNCPSPSSTSYHHDTQQSYHHRESTEQEVKEQQKGVTMTAAFFRNKPSPGSTTLEDVLDSLLGLPSASRTPSPSAKPGKSCSDLRQDLPESVKREMDLIEKTLMNNYERKDRRKSEGSDTMPSLITQHLSSRNRRVSFDNTAPTDKYVVKCKNYKCTNTTTLAEARRLYESCHYCMYLYCSKECRRAHWLHRHRKTCLHSRVGTLCRQVFSAAKDDSATLKHISLLARRGYVAHGRGAVKCFFSSPESAEKFITNGFRDLGDLTYVRSSDLLLSEMGADLYTEVMRLCKSYNADTKMVLYVAICVVKEVPCAEVGGVRWERQLISRCGKIRLDSTHQQHSQHQQHQQPEDIVPIKSTSQPVLCNITREMESPETLVLTSLPQANDAGEKENTPRKAREISFANIQRQLKLRGVSLRRHFPQVYKKLCSYVDGTVDKFAPVTIYPIDQASGKSFMCIIMLDAEPERLQLLPTDSSRVKTIDISAIEQE